MAIVLALIVSGAMALSLVASLGIGLWYAVEKMKIIRATRIEREKQAHVMIIDTSDGTWIRDTNPKAIIQALHLQQSVYANGREPMPIEAQAWQIYNAPKLASNKAQLLPGAIAEQPLDLLSVLNNEQRVLIKGVSNAGKTNLLQWIAARHQMSGSKILVIDPHSSPEKWPGCKVVGLGSDHDEIAIALDKLIDLMKRRYEDIAKGLVNEGEHSKITIIVDEWMSIAYECANAKKVMVKLLTQSRKAAFSVFVGTHSDRVASLGLDGKGDLRDGFCLVRLSIINGQRQATIDYGNGELSTVLPGQFVSNVQNGGFINLDVKPNSTEAAILELNNQGNSLNEISRRLNNGQSGGHQVDKIKSVIQKFEA